MTSLDLDEERNRVTIGLVPETAAAARKAIMTRAAEIGVDTAALWFVVERPMQPTAGAATTITSSPTGYDLNSAWSGLVGGIEILTDGTDPKAPAGGGPGNCSIAFSAVYNGVPGVFTASHCTRVWGGGPDGTTATQAGQPLGYEYADPNKYRCGLNWCRASDASFFAANGSVPVWTGLIARTTYRNSGGLSGGRGSVVTDPNDPYFFIGSTDPTGALMVGLDVDKMGRVSGWTHGPVRNTCVDHHLGNGTDQYTTRCTYQADVWNEPGDSGGAFFYYDGGSDVMLLGDVIGSVDGHTVFSKFSRIAEDFPGSLVVTRQPTLAASSISGYLVTKSNSNQDAVLSWTAVPGATKYYVYSDYSTWYYDDYGTYQCQPWGSDSLGPFTGTSATHVDAINAGSGGSICQRSYYVVAYSGTEKSPNSNTILLPEQW